MADPYKQDAVLALLATLAEDNPAARHHLLKLDFAQLITLARASAQLADHCLRVAVAHRGLDDGPQA